MRQFARVLDSEERVQHVVFAAVERNYNIVPINEGSEDGENGRTMGEGVVGWICYWARDGFGICEGVGPDLDLDSFGELEETMEGFGGHLGGFEAVLEDDD